MAYDQVVAQVDRVEEDSHRRPSSSGSCAVRRPFGTKGTAPRPLDAVVTNGWGRIAYNIVRSLGRHGLRVGVGTDEFLGMCVASRYATATFRHPAFTENPGGFIRSVRDALETYRPRVYLPSDQEALVVAKHRVTLDGLGVEIPVADFDVLRALHRKDELARVAVEAGVPIPDTCVPKGKSEAEAFARECGGRLVVKRISSAGARGVYHVSADAVGELVDQADSAAGLKWGEFVLQRYVVGASYGVSMLFNRGEPRARFTHRRLREQIRTGGISTLRMSVVNPLLEGYADRLLRRVRFHGVAMCEFKYNEATGQGWLIEVNPRFWGSLGLAIRSGVDFPFLLYQLAAEGDVPRVFDYKQGVVVKWLLGDLVAAWKGLPRSGPDRSDRRGYRAAAYDDLYIDDPLAFLAEMWFTVSKRLRTGNHPLQGTDVGLEHL
jgi:predicted ATP-grasp superfamily ATP-dependent carboligase